MTSDFQQAAPRTNPKSPGDPSLTDVDALARDLGTDFREGLGIAEAAERLRRDGPNELRAARRVPGWRRFLAHLHDPLVYLLLAAVVVALIAWVIEGRHGLPVDAIVIALVIPFVVVAQTHKANQHRSSD